MAVFYDPAALPGFHRPVVTIGSFDGVHKGHQLILREVVAQAAARGGESVLITFHPHPRQLLYPGEKFGVLTPLRQKIELVLQTGVTHVVVVPFTLSFAALTAQQYIEDFLIKQFRPECIVIGYDHRFGQNREGSITMLSPYASKEGLTVVEIPARLIDEAAISSTRIRKSIELGSVHEAAGMLGRWYSCTATVVQGRKLGRTIGYPTANLDPVDPSQIIPANGIYTVIARIANNTYGGMMSIGMNPTVSDTTEIKREVNLFDFDRDIYGAELEIAFVNRIRNEQKFDSVAALTSRLHEDKQQALKDLEHARELMA